MSRPLRTTSELRPDTVSRTPVRVVLKLLGPARLAGVFGLSFIMFVLLVHTRAFSWPTLALTPLIVALAAIVVLDLAARIIPDIVTLPILVYALLLAASGVTIPLLQAFLGAAIGGGLPLIIAMIGRGGVGGGDVKLMAALGAVFGWKGAVYVFAVSHVAGALVLLALSLIHRRFPRGRFPIGAFIAFAGVILIAAGG